MTELPATVRAQVKKYAEALMHEKALTPRQIEVVRAVLSGRSLRHIASDLGNTEKTIQSHLASACLRLGVASRAELAAMLLPIYV